MFTRSPTTALRSWRACRSRTTQTSESVPATAPARASAVVVGDPQRSLPEARREAAAVADAIRASGVLTVELLEGASATHAAVVEGLGTADLFHYAGHASYEGQDGWDSALPLAAQGRLLVTDVLALPHAPARVILSACGAARTASAAPGETLGIAQAFLVAGTDVVVAPTRDVRDEASARFFGRVYAALRRDGLGDLERAVREAELAERDRDPTSDWASFRVLRAR